jgi:hypothetical protein
MYAALIFRIKIPAMMRLLFLFLLSPALLCSQTQWTAFDTVPAGVTRIELPLSKYASGFYGAEFVITNDSVYKAQFPDSAKAKLPAIDFVRYELLSRTQCMQCLRLCGERAPCHRNACRYSRTWYLVDKQHRIAVKADTLETNACMPFRDLRSDLVCYNDSCFSVLQRNCPSLKNAAVNFAQSVVLARTVFVDCMARVEHLLYLDTLNRCVVWRMQTSYGGCHGMEEREFVLTIPKPPAGYRIVFEEYSEPDRY